jgi:hypothetical protein
MRKDMRNYYFMHWVILSLIACLAACGSGGGDSGANNNSIVSAVPAEVWRGSLNEGQIAAATTVEKNADGTLSASGDWRINDGEYVISCPFTGGSATVTKNSLTIKGSGEANATGGKLDGFQHPKFNITASGTYLNGVITNGTFTVTFSKNPPKTAADIVLPPSYTGNWFVARQSGGGITYVAPAGAYSGTYSGADSGSWQVTIDENGGAGGRLTSNTFNKSYDFFGNHNMDGSLDLQATTGNGPTYFTGSLDSATGLVSGTWNNPGPKVNKSGLFTGARK